MPKVSVIRNHCRALVLSGIMLACPVHAQIASGGSGTLFRSDAAGVRVEPQFEPRPLTFGPWLADVRVTTRVVADSNVFRTTSDTTSDVGLTISPAVQFAGGFGKHNLTMSAHADIKRWDRRPRENSETFDVSLGGRVDLGALSEATWRTQYAREVEPRGSAGANNLFAGPPQLRLLQTALTGRSMFGPLTIALGAGVVQRKYQPLMQAKGAAIDQSFRDTRALFLAPRASFNVTPATSMFLSGAVTRTTSLNRQLGGVRDATGYSILSGVRTEATQLLVGEIGVGWRGQNYSNPVYKDFGQLTYDATIDWYPTRLVSLRLQAGQDVVNSGLPQVAGVGRQTLRLNAYYDPLRNFRISLETERERDRFRELNLTTATATATLTGRYLVSRRLTMSSFWRFQNKTTSNSIRIGGFKVFAAGLALTGRL